MEKYTLDMLTQDSVSVKKQRYVEIDGAEYPVGQPWRRSYVNSARGRQAVQEEVPEPHRTAIFTVWGDTPTVDENEQEQ